jgi:hypothetical protein
MDLARYIEICRHRLAGLTESRRAITEGGMRIHSNWGQNTKGWLAELDRRIKEQSMIIARLESGQPV